MTQERTVTEYLRSRIHAHIGPDGSNVVTSLSPQEIMEEQVSFDFMERMANRMVTGYFRYGPVRNNRFDAIGDIARRVDLYLGDGNLEALVDVANLCMVEFIRPLHPDAHFASVDDGEHVMQQLNKCGTKDKGAS